MQATSLFKQAEGVRRKGRGQREVTIHNITFVQTMRKVAVQLAARSGFVEDNLVGFVNSDDLREYAEKHDIAPDHPNAWGAVFRSAPKGYRFEKTPEWRASRIASNHGREVPTWAVYREEVAA